MIALLRIFGVAVGLLTIAFGVAVMNGALVGGGPCGASCGLYRSILSLVGQAGYNRVMGLAWLLAGGAFCVASLLGKRQRK